MNIRSMAAALLLLCSSAFATDVVITWDDFINPVGTCYNLYGSGKPTGVKGKINTDLICDFTYTKTKLRPGTYTFWVTAVSASGVESTYSIPVSLTVN